MIVWFQIVFWWYFRMNMGSDKNKIWHWGDWWGLNQDGDVIVGYLAVLGGSQSWMLPKVRWCNSIIVDAGSLQARLVVGFEHAAFTAAGQQQTQNGIRYYLAHCGFSPPHQEQTSRGRLTQKLTSKGIQGQQKGILEASQGGKGNVDGIFFKRITKLVKIVIPSWKSP